MLNEENSDEQFMQMQDFDYRRNPYREPNLSTEQQNYINEDLELLVRKGVYPYEYMDSFERFEETCIPPIEAFTSSLLANKQISTTDYDHALKVFSHFEMKTLQDYHDLYLLQDVLLLNDVLEAFREVCLKAYGLDPFHYHTSPALSWDAGLKFTAVSLDLITDPDIFLFIENGIRGGISLISHRYAKANHPSLAREGY